MWDDVVKHLADYPTAVLTGLDAAGYPFSVRCKPEPDTAAQVLRVQVPETAAIQPGPAGLLCHEHDEWLWNLKSFIVRGTLEQDEQHWMLRPQRFIPGMGFGGLTGAVKSLRSARRTAKRYLDKRGLLRPSIPWDKFQAMGEAVESAK